MSYEEVIKHSENLSLLNLDNVFSYFRYADLGDSLVVVIFMLFMIFITITSFVGAFQKKDYIFNSKKAGIIFCSIALVLFTSLFVTYILSHGYKYNVEGWESDYVEPFLNSLDTNKTNVFDVDLNEDDKSSVTISINDEVKTVSVDPSNVYFDGDIETPYVTYKLNPYDFEHGKYKKGDIVDVHLYYPN